MSRTNRTLPILPPVHDPAKYRVLTPTLEGYLDAYRVAWAAAGWARAPTIAEVAAIAGRSGSSTCEALDRLASMGFLDRVERNARGDKYMPGKNQPDVPGVEPLPMPRSDVSRGAGWDGAKPKTRRKA